MLLSVEFYVGTGFRARSEPMNSRIVGNSSLTRNGRFTRNSWGETKLNRWSALVESSGKLIAQSTKLENRLGQIDPIPSTVHRGVHLGIMSLGIALARGGSRKIVSSHDDDTEFKIFLESSLPEVVWGRNIATVVPELPLLVFPYNWMLPPCFSTMLRLTHSPSPVPLSSLVVTNGLNSRARSCSGTPMPSSTMRTTTPF
jgi:hypothetical protein